MCLDKSSNAVNVRSFIMYEKLLDLNALFDSVAKCRKGVDWKHSVQCYCANALSNIIELRNRLKDGTYEQLPFHEFDIIERGKPRHIRALHFKDRILQRVLCDLILLPELRKYFIYDNSASLKQKGVSFARKRVKVHLEKYRRKYGMDGYVLMIDLKGFFDSIAHKPLMEMFRARLKDEKLIKLMEKMIIPFGNGKSLGLGSQVSQVSGIMFPTPIDNYCKIVRGCKFYGRYMDDIYIIHKDKRFLLDVLEGVKKICAELELGINLKKTQIIRLKNGFTFLKMRYLYTETGHIKVIPCKRTFIREKRKLKKLVEKARAGIIKYDDIAQQYRAWRGNVSLYDSHRSVIAMDRFYKEVIANGTECDT